MRTLVDHIGCITGIERQGRLRLCGAEMDRMETLEDAWLLVEEGRIAAFGRRDDGVPADADRRIDARGGMLFPSFCDSHTHLVYAGSREQEFLDKINGLSYEEIARRGGGILNSADRLHAASEEELYRTAMERVAEIAAMGTGCVEIKSGYGLSTEDELKILDTVCSRFGDNSSRQISRTSHDEQAWQDYYKHPGTIPFDAAFSLKSI